MSRRLPAAVAVILGASMLLTACGPAATGTPSAPAAAASDAPLADTIAATLPPAAQQLADTNRMLVADNRLSPLAASRVYAFTQLAAWQAHRQAPDGQKEAAAAVAGAVVGQSLFAVQPSAVNEYKSLSMRYRTIADDTRDQAIAIGTELAKQAQDHYQDSFTPLPDPPATTDWDWRPTGNARESMLAPGWGTMPTITDADTCQTARPDYNVLETQGRAMLATWKPENAADPTVLRWLGGLGSPAPAGMWLQIAQRAARENKLDPAATTRLLAAVAIADYDAGIDMWRDKLAYHVARPETMWQKWTGTPVTMLRETPNHPSYPSGHSGFSGAAAAVITDAIGDTPVTLVLPPDNGVPAESITYPSAWTAAHEASASRVIAGFHYPLDTTAGEDLGRCVGEQTLAWMDAEAGS